MVGRDGTFAPANFVRGRMAVDEQLIETAGRSLYAAVLSDVLDGLGYRHQVMPP